MFSSLKLCTLKLQVLVTKSVWESPVICSVTRQAESLGEEGLSLNQISSKQILEIIRQELDRVHLVTDRQLEMLQVVPSNLCS